MEKLKMELPFDLAIPLPEIYPKNPETLIRKNICTLFTTAKVRNQPKCSCVDEWTKRKL